MARGIPAIVTPEVLQWARDLDRITIALAKQQNCKVVTEEVPTHNMNSPKIPDVCAAYNIECIDFIAFAREEKFAF